MQKGILHFVLGAEKLELGPPGRKPKIKVWSPWFGYERGSSRGLAPSTTWLLGVKTICTLLSDKWNTPTLQPFFQQDTLLNIHRNWIEIRAMHVEFEKMSFNFGVAGARVHSQHWLHKALQK